MVPSSSNFPSQKFGSHLNALGCTPAPPYRDILGIAQVYLLGIACVSILVQALSFITWMTPSNPLTLCKPGSPLAGDIGHQAVATSAGTNSTGRSVLFYSLPSCSFSLGKG